MIVTQSDNTIVYKMGGQTLLLDVPGHVNTIRQFKNNLLGVYKNYRYNNLVVCYNKRGKDYLPDDDSFIDFNQTYYVVRRPMECELHFDPNNMNVILNFNSDCNSDDSDSDSDYSDSDSDDSSDSENSEIDGMPDLESIESNSDSDTSDCTENDDYDIDYNEPINME